jgi:hypothetical protein
MEMGYWGVRCGIGSDEVEICLFGGGGTGELLRSRTWCLEASGIQYAFSRQPSYNTRYLLLYIQLNITSWTPFKSWEHKKGYLGQELFRN